MDRGAWLVTLHGVSESDMTEPGTQGSGGDGCPCILYLPYANKPTLCIPLDAKSLLTGKDSDAGKD